MKNLKEIIGSKKKICGIYKIISPSNKVYVGQSVCIYSRMSSYKNIQNNSQPKIYRSLKKYGFEEHTFELLEECESKNLKERETYYKIIELEKVNMDFTKVLFCDIYDTGGGERSDETRKNISNGKIGKKHKLHTNKGRPRPGWMNDEIKNKIRLANKDRPKPPRTKEHGIKLGIAQLGKSKGHLGRISPMKGRIHKDESKIKAKLNNLGKNNKAIIQYSLTGDLIKEWDSITSACKYLRKNNTGGISKCARGKSNNIYGFIWKYKEN